MQVSAEKKKRKQKDEKSWDIFSWKHEINFSDNYTLVVSRVLQKILFMVLV